MIPLSLQLKEFLITIGIGLIMGLTYDIYRLVLNHYRWRRWGRDIGDFIFWLLVTILVFFLLLYGNWGEVRLYVLIGLIIGLLLYFKSFTKKVRKIILQILRFTKKVISITLATILFPLRIMQKIIIVPLGFIGMGMNKFLGGLGWLGNRYIFSPVKQSYGRSSKIIKGRVRNWLEKKLTPKE